MYGSHVVKPDSAVLAELYRTLGQTVVAFQHLESAVTQALLWIVNPEWGLADRQTTFLSKVLDELSFAARLKLLSNFVHTTSVEDFVRLGSKYARTRADEYPELVEKLKKGISLAQRAEERRNQLIHSQWLTDGSFRTMGPGEIMRMKTRLRADKDVNQSERVTIEALDSVVRSMEEAKDLIRSASWRLGDAVFNALDEDGSASNAEA